jgi:hypothetical protein
LPLPGGENACPDENDGSSDKQNKRRSTSYEQSAKNRNNETT